MDKTNPEEAIRFSFKITEPPPAIMAEYGTPEPKTANDYFCQRYLSVARLYGTPFLEAVNRDSTIPVLPNEDFFAGVLRGEKAMGHDVIFYVLEQQFFFFDCRLGYYVATSEEKLKLLLSQVFIRAAQAMSNKINVSPFITTMRDEKQLNAIVKRAKALLAVDTKFFENNGHKRMKDGAIIDPAAVPAHKRFVLEVVEERPDEILTVQDAYLVYCEYCQQKQLQPMKIKGFKGLMEAAIKEAYGLGVRNDLRRNDRWNQGWKGLGYRAELFAVSSEQTVGMAGSGSLN